MVAEEYIPESYLYIMHLQVEHYLHDFVRHHLLSVSVVIDLCMFHNEKHVICEQKIDGELHVHPAVSSPIVETDMPNYQVTDKAQDDYEEQV